MTTLEDLYFGKINPNERDTKRGSKMDQLVKLMCKNEDGLNATLTEQQKETFEKSHDCWNEYMSLAEAAIFEYAFRLGARLAMEVQSDSNE